MITHARHLNKVTISKNALRVNHTALQKAHPETQICPNLKSNAYGHGLEKTASIFDSMRCPYLIVDSLPEAYKLYEKNLNTPILIMGYVLPTYLTVSSFPFQLAVYDIKIAKILNKHQLKYKIHIFVDTGMNREGVTLTELPKFLSELKKLSNLEVVGLCSHFADADNPKSQEFVNKQINIYKKALNIINDYGFNPKWKHISASAGAFKSRDNTFNMIRAGLTHYGINPLENNDEDKNNIDLQPALEFISTLVQIKNISKNDKVGYNCTFIAERDMTIGLIPAGYYEGIDRRLSNKGYVKIRDEFCPIVGRVSMNMTTVDISKLNKLVIGEPVTVYSSTKEDKNSITNTAKTAKTIPYKILTGISESIPREII